MLNLLGCIPPGPEPGSDISEGRGRPRTVSCILNMVNVFWVTLRPFIFSFLWSFKSKRTLHCVALFLFKSRIDVRELEMFITILSFESQLLYPVFFAFQVSAPVAHPEDELERLTKKMLYDMDNPPSEEYFGKILQLISLDQHPTCHGRKTTGKCMCRYDYGLLIKWSQCISASMHQCISAVKPAFWWPAGGDFFLMAKRV